MNLKIVPILLILCSSLFALNVVSDSDNRAYERLFELFKNEKNIDVKLNIVSNIKEYITNNNRGSEVDVIITDNMQALSTIYPLLKPITSDKIEDIEHKDYENRWVGIAKIAKVALFLKGMDIQDLAYEDLASKSFESKVVLSSYKDIYNQSLFSSFIIHHGLEYAKDWANHVRLNMDKRVLRDDFYSAGSIANGVGKISIVKSNTIGLMATNRDNLLHKEWIKNLQIKRVVFRKGGKTHFNIRAVAIANESVNEEDANEFVGFLLGKKAQKMFVDLSYENPIIKGVKLNEYMISFKEDVLPFNMISRLNKRSKDILKKSGWE